MLSGGQRTPTIVNPVGRPIGSSMKTDGQHERGEMQEEKSGRTTRRRESSAARSRTKDPRKSDDKEMGKLSTRGTAADDAKSDKEERAGAKAVPNGPQNVLVINDEPSRKKTAPVSLKHRSQSKHTVRNGKDYPQEFAEAVATGEVDREQETTGGHGGNKRASSAAMTRPKVNNASGVPPSLLAFGKSGSVEVRASCANMIALFKLFVTESDGERPYPQTNAHDRSIDTKSKAAYGYHTRSTWGKF